MPRKSHKQANKKKQNKRQTLKRSSPIVLQIAPAPVSRGVSFHRRTAPKTVTRGNSTHVMNQVILPFDRTSNTGTVTITTDIIAANATTFPFLSAIASRYDKVKWHKLNIRFIPAVPTTTGGTMSMYFDNDRRDAGATTVTDAMQNTNCRTHPIWKEFSYNLNKRQLRSNEMFTTASATQSLANDENTFVSPGRVHLVSTPMTGVTFSTATTVGYLAIDYHAELLFPSNPQTGVPTRRKTEQLKDTSFIQYDSRHVSAYENFAAGCISPPDFYQFMGCFDDSGNFNASLTSKFDPDLESFKFEQFLVPNRPENVISQFSGKVVGPTRPARLMGGFVSEAFLHNDDDEESCYEDSLAEGSDINV